MQFIVDSLPLWMFLVLAVLLFSGYPVAFVLGGVAIAFGLVGLLVGSFQLVNFYNIVTRIWGGAAENPTLTAIPMFILMGAVLDRSGMGESLLQSLHVLLRRVPGGLAVAVTAMGTVMAASMGIIGASITLMTILALPMMMRSGYSAPLATGTIAASGTLGILIPPSIMLVMMADLLSKSAAVMFVAALLPGLLLSALYMVFIVGVAIVRPALAPPMKLAESRLRPIVLLRLAAFGIGPALLLILLTLGSILLGWATPTEAAAVGAAGAFLLAVVQPLLERGLGQIPGGRLPEIAGASPAGSLGARLREAIEQTAITGGMLFMVVLGATAFSYVFRALGGDDAVLGLVDKLDVGAWGLLLILMALVFAMGFFFDWIEIVLIVFPVFAPVIASLDFGAHVPREEAIYWFAILMAVNLQTSFLTPPFGFALFYMKGAAPEGVNMKDIYVGIIPFVMLQLMGLGLVMAFPNIPMWLPRVLLL